MRLTEILRRWFAASGPARPPGEPVVDAGGHGRLWVDAAARQLTVIRPSGFFIIARRIAFDTVRDVRAVRLKGGGGAIRIATSREGARTILLPSPDAQADADRLRRAIGP